MQRQEQRALLDTIRWLSAGMVAFGHTWITVFAREDHPVSRVLWALADTRHSWLILFFVLSGYLVGGGVLQRADRFDFARYAIARFSRIYVVLIPALLLTAGLDAGAHLIAPDGPVHAGAWSQAVFGDTPPFARYTPREILASLLCLENAVGAPMGSNGPLWSLGFEWMFYFCFPALLLAADAMARRTGWRIWEVRGGLLLASALLLVALHMPYACLLWLIWVAGALAHVIADKGVWPPWARWLGGLACLAGFGLAFHVNYRFSDLVIGFGASAFLSRFPAAERGIDRSLDHRLAGASYSLYVTHLPVLAFLCMLFHRAGLTQPAGVPFDWASVFLVMVAAIALNTLAFHRFFESRTDAVRGWLSSRLRRQRA